MQNNGCDYWSGGGGGYSGNDYQPNSNSYHPSSNYYQANSFEINQRLPRNLPERGGINSFDNKRGEFQSNTTSEVNNNRSNQWSGELQRSTGTENSFGNQNNRGQFSNTVTKSSYPGNNGRVFHNYSGPSSNQSNAGHQNVSRFVNGQQNQWSSGVRNNANTGMSRFGNNQRNQEPFQFQGNSELNSYGNERSKTKREMSGFENSQMNRGPRGFQGSTEYPGRFENNQRNVDQESNRNNQEKPISSYAGYGLNCFDNQGNQGSTSQRNYSGLERNHFENMGSPVQNYRDSFEQGNRKSISDFIDSNTADHNEVKNVKLESYYKDEYYKYQLSNDVEVWKNNSNNQRPSEFQSQCMNSFSSSGKHDISKLKAEPGFDYSEDIKILAMTRSDNYEKRDITKLNEGYELHDSNDVVTSESYPEIDGKSDLTEQMSDVEFSRDVVSQKHLNTKTKKNKKKKKKKSGWKEQRSVINNNQEEGIVPRKRRKNLFDETSDDEDFMKKTNLGYFRKYETRDLLDLFRGCRVQLTGKFIKKNCNLKKNISPRFGGFQDNTGYVHIIVPKKNKELFKHFEELENRSEITVRGKLMNRPQGRRDRFSRNGKIEIEIVELPSKRALQMEAAEVDFLLNEELVPKLTNAQRKMLFTEAAQLGPGNIPFLRAFKNREKPLQDILLPEELALANRNCQTIATHEELSRFIDRQLKVRKILGIESPKA